MCGVGRQRSRHVCSEPGALRIQESIVKHRVGVRLTSAYIMAQPSLPEVFLTLDPLSG